MDVKEVSVIAEKNQDITFFKKAVKGTYRPNTLHTTHNLLCKLWL